MRCRPEGDDSRAKAGNDGDERAEDDACHAGHLQVGHLWHQPRVLPAGRQLYCNCDVSIPCPPERHLSIQPHATSPDMLCKLGGPKHSRGHVKTNKRRSGGVPQHRRSHDLFPALMLQVNEPQRL